MQSHPLRTSKSPLKWAGGKSKLLPQLAPLLPPGRRLIEPFVGAGSVFLGTDYHRYVLNDANTDLMAMWSAIQQRPREFVERAAALFVEQNRTRDSYLRIRAEFNSATDRFERAVRLVYLNKFGFNGIFRVNRRDEFNVPYGNPRKLPLFPHLAIQSAAMKLERCVLMAGSFRAAMDLADEGDVIYCDPPYSASSNGESFTQYTAAGFGSQDHAALVDAGRAAAARGAIVLVSNHDTADARSLYAGWELHPLKVGRTVGGAAGSRRTASELVAKLDGRCSRAAPAD